MQQQQDRASSGRLHVLFPLMPIPEIPNGSQMKHALIINIA
jgi:hypothetical protein